MLYSYTDLNYLGQRFLLYFTRCSKKHFPPRPYGMIKLADQASYLQNFGKVFIDENVLISCQKTYKTNHLL